ncbi:unnamed protein product, partial [Allacma fusca]
DVGFAECPSARPTILYADCELGLRILAVFSNKSWKDSAAESALQFESKSKLQSWFSCFDIPQMNAIKPVYTPLFFRVIVISLVLVTSAQSSNGQNSSIPRIKSLIADSSLTCDML